MPNAREAARNENTKEKFFLIGETGAGKTSQFLTLPGRKFIYLFDPSALNTLKGHDVEYEAFYPDLLPLGAQSLTKGKSEGSKSRAAQEPKTYLDWEKDFEGKLDSDYFENYDVLGFDSFTTFSDILMDRILWINGRPGQQPQQDDWAAQMVSIRNVVRTMTAMNKILFFTGHVDMKQDEQTKRMVNQILLTGQLRSRLPLLFSEIYFCECRSTNSEIKYVIQTRPDRLNPKIRSTIQGLEMYEDVTIGDWKKPEDYGLGKVIRKLSAGKSGSNGVQSLPPGKVATPNGQAAQARDARELSSGTRPSNPAPGK
jgi:hypothetical protein